MFFFKKYNFCLIFLGFFYVSLLSALHSPQVLFYNKDHSWEDVLFYESVLKEDWENLSNEKKRSALEDFIKTELAFVAAKEDGLFLYPQIKQKLDNQFLFSLINATYKNQIATPLIDLNTVKQNSLFLEKQVEAYHLLVGFSDSIKDTESSISQEEAGVLADSLLLVINNSSLPLVDSFKDVASRFSIDPSVKTNQGYLGWVPWGQTVMSFQKPLFEGLYNVVLGPVLTEYGYHLILKTQEKKSNYYYFSESSYKDLSWVVAENSLSFDGLKMAASDFDSLLIKESGFQTNKEAVGLLLKEILSHSKGNFNIEKSLENLRFSPLVLLAFNGRGFGFGWFFNKIKKVPSSRIPYIKTEQDLLSLLKTLVLQDLVFDLGLSLNIDSSSVFKRDLDRVNKNTIYNEYIKYLYSQEPKPDSSMVLQKYNQSLLSGMFIEPRRVVFSEIRVFDEGVAESLHQKILSGASFDLLLKEYGGSIKEPLTLGNNNPVTSKAFSLSVGDVSSIIINNSGSFSIIRVEAFLEETPFSLDRVYAQLERELITKKQEEIKENLFSFLVERFGVFINFGVVGL